MKKVFSKVKVVKGISRELFRDMPKSKRIEDKRHKRPKHKASYFGDVDK